MIQSSLLIFLLVVQVGSTKEPSCQQQAYTLDSLSSSPLEKICASWDLMSSRCLQFIVGDNGDINDYEKLVNAQTNYLHLKLRLGNDQVIDPDKLDPNVFTLLESAMNAASKGIEANTTGKLESLTSLPVQAKELCSSFMRQQNESNQSEGTFDPDAESVEIEVTGDQGPPVNLSSQGIHSLDRIAEDSQPQQNLVLLNKNGITNMVGKETSSTLTTKGITGPVSEEVAVISTALEDKNVTNMILEAIMDTRDRHVRPIDKNFNRASKLPDEEIVQISKDQKGLTYCDMLGITDFIGETAEVKLSGLTPQCIRIIRTKVFEAVFATPKDVAQLQAQTFANLSEDQFKYLHMVGALASVDKEGQSLSKYVPASYFGQIPSSHCRLLDNNVEIARMTQLADRCAGCVSALPSHSWATLAKALGPRFPNEYLKKVEFNFGDPQEVKIVAPIFANVQFTAAQWKDFGSESKDFFSNLTLEALKQFPEDWRRNINPGAMTVNSSLLLGVPDDMPTKQRSAYSTLIDRVIKSNDAMDGTLRPEVVLAIVVHGSLPQIEGLLKNTVYCGLVGKNLQEIEYPKLAKTIELCGPLMSLQSLSTGQLDQLVRNCQLSESVLRDMGRQIDVGKIPSQCIAKLSPQTVDSMPENLQQSLIPKLSIEQTQVLPVGIACSNLENMKPNVAATMTHVNHCEQKSKK